MKLIAFYLPQFHRFPENDQWWREGFTEWTNTRKAVPLYKGHYEPREPLNDNYYCLLDKSTFEWQIDLAQQYGIYGFCFYHYWFEGHMLMQKPMEMFLQNPSLNLKFCISWANETWSRRMNGSNQDILIKQTYGNESTWKQHFTYLLPFFKDKRYIYVDGKPLFVLYKPEIFPEYMEMIDLWNQLAIENGLDGISFAVQGAQWNNEENVDDSKVDYRIMYEPSYTNTQPVSQKGVKYEFVTKLYHLWSYLNPQIHVQKVPYNLVCSNILNRKVKSDKYIPGIFVDWDNTARKGSKGLSYFGSTPSVFKYYLSELIRKTKAEYKKEIIFINAWNEWAEGCYLEPDKRYKYGYLEAVRDALIENGEFINGE